MIYLEKFLFPSEDSEFKFILSQKRTCYDTFYPFKILSEKNFFQMDFAPVTILSGSNGSGKSTALNIIAEKLRLTREAYFNKSNFFQNYVDLCTPYLNQTLPKCSRIITSDDVFDYMLNVRSFNQNIDNKRDKLFEEFVTLKYSGKYSDFHMKSLDDYEELKKLVAARKNTQSKFIRKTLHDNVREYSNGENAFNYFTDKIKDEGLYILDEPENSLSAERQLKLVEYIEQSAKFFDCQFIISTHSVFLLSIKGAKIYDMDENPVDVKQWQNLKISRIYSSFFKKHECEFD